MSEIRMDNRKKDFIHRKVRVPNENKAKDFPSPKGEAESAREILMKITLAKFQGCYLNRNIQMFSFESIWNLSVLCVFAVMNQV